MIPKSSRTGGGGAAGRWARTAGLLGLSVLTLLLACGGALAAEDAKQKDDAVKLEAVKVTANKMEEDPMDVPQNITVISDVDIEEKGMKDIKDVINSVPGMSNIANGHGNQVNFRGLNASVFTQNNPVALYVDGVGYSNSNGFDASLVNVERVEVLHGAQSTLYGKDAMGAVINVISKDPTNEWQGTVGAEGGSWWYGKGTVSLNGPLVEDNLYLGFGGQYQRDEGWIKNEHADMEDDANRKRNVRANTFLLWTPESNDKLKVRLAVRHDQDKHYWNDEYDMGAGKDLSSFSADDAKHVNYDVDTWSKVTDDFQTAKVEYEYTACKLDSITTHKTQKVKGIYDADFGNDPLYDGMTMYDDGKSELWSQEFRFASSEAEGFRWTAGVYGDSGSSSKGPYGQQGYSLGVPYDYDARSKQDSDTLATFGQFMIPLGSGFELTLGGRAQRIRKSINMTFYQTNLTTGALVYSYHMEGDKTENALLPKAALTYDINDNWASYASYSHGYMPGGFNDFAMAGSLADNTFKPEKSRNYEMGVKAGYDTVQMSADVFYMDIEDIHVYKITGGMFTTDNAKKAHSMGSEFQITYLPFETVELSAGGSVIRARYDDYDVGTKNLRGERIEQTPDYSLMLGAAYHDPSGFYARADGRHFGIRSFYNSSSQNFTTADPYTVVDGRVGYRIDDFDVYAYMKNIFNEGYVTGYRANGLISMAGVGEPRNMGVGVNYSF
ncbi:MAG: TonB-dependent receptor [Pseudodesulfovibrio sp.]